MSVFYYTYNEFPYGTYEISAAILLQYNNNKAYPDIINIIKNYTSLLGEHIRYCNDFYIASKTNSAPSSHGNHHQWRVRLRLIR